MLSKTPTTKHSMGTATTQEALSGGAPSAGVLVRLLRRRRNVTLEQLALEVGLSKGHLSRYERGEKVLSVPALIRLARALDTSVAALLGETEHRGLVHVVRAGSKAARSVKNPDGTYEVLALGPPGSVRSSAFIARFPSEATTSADAYHAGEEMLYVLSGSVEMELQSSSVLLRRGDFAQFPGSAHHRLRALEKGTEVLVIVVDESGRADSIRTKGTKAT